MSLEFLNAVKCIFDEVSTDGKSAQASVTGIYSYRPDRDSSKKRFMKIDFSISIDQLCDRELDTDGDPQRLMKITMSEERSHFGSKLSGLRNLLDKPKSQVFNFFARLSDNGDMSLVENVSDLGAEYGYTPTDAVHVYRDDKDRLKQPDREMISNVGTIHTHMNESEPFTSFMLA